MSYYDLKDAGYFSIGRVEILDLVPVFSSRVLEIGCGSGQTLAILKKMERCRETVGIEVCVVAAETARNQVDTVFCLDAERDGMPPDIGRFDLILLLDVLEHLIDPWQFLAQVREKYLQDGGRIIISLPNARHLSLVFPLLLGRFDYVESGVRDRTHLRFFTLSSALQMIRSAGLNVERYRPNGRHGAVLKKILSLLTFGIASGFITYQYVFLASAAKCPCRSE